MRKGKWNHFRITNRKSFCDTPCQHFFGWILKFFQKCKHNQKVFLKTFSFPTSIFTTKLKTKTYFGIEIRNKREQHLGLDRSMTDTELKKVAATPEKMKIRRRERERDIWVRESVCVWERETCEWDKVCVWERET